MNYLDYSHRSSCPVAVDSYQVRTPALFQPHGSFGSQRVGDLTSPLADAGKLFSPLPLVILTFFATLPYRTGPCLR
jgi:hypothetical protein